MMPDRRSLDTLTCTLALLLSAACQSVLADDEIPLTNPRDKAAWRFDNGREFPGATGKLTVESEGAKSEDVLKLVGDFTGGGGYVQAGRSIDDVPIRDLVFRVRSPNTNRLVVRFGDGSKQTHQFALELDPEQEWQQVVLPIEDFFERRGRADAVTMVRQYQYWGGAKDGQWHGPATAVYFLLGNDGSNEVRTLWLSDVVVRPRPVPVAGQDVVDARRLDEIVEGVHDWRFSHGQEFPGATGALTVVDDEPAAGDSSLRLAGDFTKGGAYVAAIRDLPEGREKETKAIRFRAKTTTARSFTTQIVDASGQTHQRKALPLQPDGEWHEVVLDPREIAGGEHWGGTNDGKWHGPARKLVLSLTTRSDPDGKRPAVLLDRVTADVVLPVFAQPPAYRETFESVDLAKSWTVTTGVAIEPRAEANGRVLTLARSLKEVLEPRKAVGPTFEASPGKWEIGLVQRRDLESPDNSYSAVVVVECLDAAGKAIDEFTIVDVFGRGDSESVKKVVEFPERTAAARFRMQLNKTYGRFDVDDLTASYLAPPPRRDDAIERLLFSTERLGNLLYPDDPRRVGITVETRKPLPESRREITCLVRDYWGAEHTRPLAVRLGPPRRERDRFVHEGTLDLGEAPLEVGRYYEVHAAIPFAGGEPFRNHTSLAILPEAVTKRFRPEDVPFTARNWDNRITEFVRLTDRLGIRVCGLWGGWKSTAPYEPTAPQIELVEKLGMGWLTTTPATRIERGSTDYDEKALRQGVRNLIEEYGDVRPMIVNLGNEPHGTGDVVKRNVEAYRVLYDEIKKVDPSIPVVATSVEPNEEYFRAGYGKYCDAYDFHIYEDTENVRRTMREYRALARKYSVEKPIWSTELGLNSQGQPRRRVAVELIRKFSVFFAEGGANVSWFGLLYPDPDGKSFGSSGDSHNVFDCRFNRYAPRLDAVAYYHMVNGIAVKKFVEEKRYPNGVQAFLFRDDEGRCLQVVWNDEKPRDVRLPLPGVETVQLVHVDGRTRTLRPGGEGLSVTTSSDPLLLLYDAKETSLAERVAPAPVRLAAPPESVSADDPTEIHVVAPADHADRIALVTPPFWKATRTGTSPAGAEVDITFTLTPPETTSVRELELTITIDDADGNRTGELTHRLRVAD